MHEDMSGIDISGSVSLSDPILYHKICIKVVVIFERRLVSLATV